MRVSCNMAARKCAVRSIVDYRLADPGRRLLVAGATRLDLGIGFGGPAPRILYEEGRLDPVARR